jgi:glycosyltransferase involved in cell wall biosynthesis
MSKISVIIPNFNCAQFLQRSIDSVLSQSIEDLEVLIIDDGSTDDSVSVIQNVTDPRVRSIIQPRNTGGASAINIGIRNTTAPLIAICNADDEWLPQKLAAQLSFSDKQSPGAIFSDCDWIDEAGRSLSRHEVPEYDVFKVHNRSRNEWIRTLFEINCLCHPSVLIRRQVYEDCGFYDNRFRQLPDFDMWLRTIQKFDIFVVPEKLVRFRLRTAGSNTSAVSPVNSTRDANEVALILENFFRSLDENEFVRAFGSLKQPGSRDFSLHLEKIFFLAAKNFRFPTMLRNIAGRFLFEFLEDPENYRLAESYGENYDLIYRLQGISTPFYSTHSLGQLSAHEKHDLMFGSPSSKDSVQLQPSSERSINFLKEDLVRQKELRIAALKQHIRELELLISESGAQREAFKFDLVGSKHQIEALRKEVGELKVALSAIGNSRSWKTTAPIRKLRSRKSLW